MAKYLDDNGLLYVLQDLLNRLGAKQDTITISEVINSTSTNATVAGTKAVYDYVTAAIAGVTGISAQIVTTLPAVGQNNVIYLVAKATSGTNNAYDEYMWISSSWEMIGTTDVELSGYLKTTDIADWAKSETKPTYTAAEVGAAPKSHASTATTYGVSSTTAYGHAMASSTAPKAAGTAAVGTEATKFARGDHVHPVQTSVSGNAGTATKLATARTINGVAFDGTANITIGVTAMTNAEIDTIITAAGG